MALAVRLLAPGDEDIATQLAREDADFDLDHRGAPLELLDAVAARSYLSDPNVLHWIAEDEKTIVGHMLCHQLRMRAGPVAELVLYEIGVRSSQRRNGVGRALVDAAIGWMKERKLKAIWVLADNDGAIDFYRACGFDSEQGTAVYMLREI